MFNNQATLTGNLGKVPEIKTITSGKVANFSMAVTERWTSKTTGECKENTEWFRLFSFNSKVIAALEAGITRGSFVRVKGKIRNRSYEANGATKQTVEIEVFDISVIAKKGSSEQQAAA